MSKQARKPCPQCERLRRRLEQLEPQLEAQAAQLKSLQSEMVCLREKLAAAQKDSSTSSKPPSSDIVKPPPATSVEGSQPRKIGGQPCHPKHEREPFPPEQVTHFEEHLLEACPCCGGRLRRNGHLARVVQQIDIERPPLTVEQHTSPEYWCERCQQSFKAPMPSVIEKGGLVGPQLTALIAYLKGACHASFSTTRKFLRDVVGVTISRGELCKIRDKVSAALDKPYGELLAALPNEEVVNVDETGHKENRVKWWTWCFRAELYTLYHIDAYRNAEVLMTTLGKEFAGVLGCDYFSAYRRYLRECSVCLQFCLAHLIRDVKFLTTLPDVRDQQYGERLRVALKNLFAVFHQREQLTEEVFAARLCAAREQVLQAGLNQVPPTRHSQNMARRFRKHGEAYFTFITTPGVAPTNNLAEQAIRFVVIDRLITQGTRSESGRRWSERIWTVIATCAQQGESVYTYLADAIARWFAGESAPSLLLESMKG
jgi:transposase